MPHYFIALDTVTPIVRDSGGSFVHFEKGRVIAVDYIDRDAGTLIIDHDDGTYLELYSCRDLVPVSSLSEWQALEYRPAIEAAKRAV